jgi:SAM-dependent methyltransferase
MDAVTRCIRDWYDARADAYVERTARYDQFPGLRGEISQFADGLVHSSGPILDLGCGGGRDSEFFLGRGHEVVAVDVSMAMVRATLARCGSRKLSGVQLDMGGLPFAGRSFGGAWICASMVHVPMARLPGCLAELCRTLDHGASAAISMKEGSGEGWFWSVAPPGLRWFTLVTATEMLAMMGMAGFVELSAVSSNRADWFVVHGSRP